MSPPPARACALCATPCRPPYLAPPPELAPDLDLRPGEPTRSTLPRWLATCRGCGATAPDLATLPTLLRETVASPGYAALRGTAPHLPFLRHALLCQAADDHNGAALATLEAAWTHDDAGSDAEAALLRRRAAELWAEPDTAQDRLRLVDVLRRAGDFDAARARATTLLATRLEETDTAILRFQLTLIDARDPARHLLSSALRPPSRTPHASHGRQPAATSPARTLWQRLTGR